MRCRPSSQRRALPKARTNLAAGLSVLHCKGKSYDAAVPLAGASIHVMVEDRMCGRACDSHLRLHVGGYTQSSRYRQTGRPRSVSTSASVTRPPRARNADGISSERVAQLRTGTLKARHHGFHSVYLVCPNGTAEADHRCPRGDPGPAPLARRHCNSEGWRLRPATLSVAEQRSRDRPPYPTQPR